MNGFIVLFDWQDEKTPGKVSFQIEVRLFGKDFIAFSDIPCYKDLQSRKRRCKGARLALLQSLHFGKFLIERK